MAKDIDLAACAIRVERQLTEMPGGGYAHGPPKSYASVRTVSIPSLIMPRIRRHLSHYTGQDADALVFTSPTGRPVRHGNFRRRVWLPALRGFRADFHATSSGQDSGVTAGRGCHGQMPTGHKSSSRAARADGRDAQNRKIWRKVHGVSAGPDSRKYSAGRLWIVLLARLP